MTLTTRQFTVARLAADGLTNKQIAREIGRSPATVKIHLDAVRAKLGVRRRAAFGTKLAEMAA
jgi:DNA-binding NarL/FixJ family response regulator